MSCTGKGCGVMHAEPALVKPPRLLTVARGRFWRSALAERQRIGDGGPGDGLPLSALNDLDRWVTWRNEQRKGKVTEVPYSPRTGYRAKADDPTTWAKSPRPNTGLLFDNLLIQRRPEGHRR